jgi:hypothetical protein
VNVFIALKTILALRGLSILEEPVLPELADFLRQEQTARRARRGAKSGCRAMADTM